MQLNSFRSVKDIRQIKNLFLLKAILNCQCQPIKVLLLIVVQIKLNLHLNPIFLVWYLHNNTRVLWWYNTANIQNKSYRIPWVRSVTATTETYDHFFSRNPLCRLHNKREEKRNVVSEVSS